MVQVSFKRFGDRIMPGIGTGDELLFETDEIVTAYFAVKFGNVVERNTAPDQKAEIFYFAESLLGISFRTDFDQTRLVGRIQVTGSFGASSDYRPCGIVCHIVDESVLTNFPPVPWNLNIPFPRKGSEPAGFLF
jgi:hypothetical protein